MPALVESDEEEEDDTNIKDPLPEKLQNSMVTIFTFILVEDGEVQVIISPRITGLSLLAQVNLG